MRHVRAFGVVGLALALALAGCAAGPTGAGDEPRTGPPAPVTSAATTPTRSTTPIGATTTSTGSTGSTPCHPAAVLPFQCGTYRSVFGAKSVTGDTGGPAIDHLTISFSRSARSLGLRAVSANCFDATLPVVVRGRRILRAGTPRYGQNDCYGHGADKRSWGYAFLNGPLTFDAGGGDLAFNLGTTLVTFDYQGATPPGQKPIERNDRTCIAAHVAPFSCGSYRARSGTGTLAFLAAHPYRLGFEHINGQLTATLDGGCNALSPTLQVDGPTVLAMRGASSSAGCPAQLNKRDDALVRFFDGPLDYRVEGDVLTFSSGSSTAVFRRRWTGQSGPPS